RRIGLRRDVPGVQRHSRWARVAHAVMRRPVAVLVPVLAFLLVIGSPFLQLKQGVPDASVNPAGVPSRDAWVALQEEFRAGETTPIIILLDTSAGATDEETITAVAALSDRLTAVEGVDRVEGPFTLTDP